MINTISLKLGKISLKKLQLSVSDGVNVNSHFAQLSKVYSWPIIVKALSFIDIN